MAGTLYIVATPIGNLDDMPPRVAATFGAADFIAAEDTRVTMKLLNFLGLKKPMVSYYEHALQKGEGILRRIEAGENCALCSDAGMPCVSDPGEVIVRDALARGIKVVPVPAASACVTALAQCPMSPVAAPESPGILRSLPSSGHRSDETLRDRHSASGQGRRCSARFCHFRLVSPLTCNHREHLMLTLTTETALDILIDWLRDNINCDTPIIFDNDEDNTDSAALLPWIEQASKDVSDLRHLKLLQHVKTK